MASHMDTVEIFELNGTNHSDTNGSSVSTGAPYVIPAYINIVGYLNLYTTPIIVFFGLVGNVLSFLVFNYTYLHRLSSSTYLAALALTDQIFLTMLLVGPWLQSLSAETPQGIDGLCQLQVYFTNVVGFLSVAYVVGFTVERYVAVCYPLKRPEFCTSKRAKCVVISLAVFACVFNSVSLFTNGIRDGYCAPLIEEHMELIMGFTYIDTVVTLILPTALLIFMNIRIATKVAYFYSNRQVMHTASSTDKLTVVLMRFHNGVQTVDTGLLTHGGKRLRRTQVKITKMLLLVSTVFLVLNLPSHSMRVYHLVVTSKREGYSVSPLEWALQQIFQLLYYTNFAINFALYSLSGQNFRKALRRLLGKVKYKANRFFTHVGTTMRRRSVWSRSSPLPDIDTRFTP
ncbi:thyrotropin-releasing hormone receptor [Lingula anatina]|uniref:Thyrotropin-releasing hormone receptor n=1 Tax=Lingula anatina TaxID=7574 RepID=A0A1S3IQW9_LINAN|nr:thyrotropin-releasing hormone receptor [Lingula anatina]|eukprot:XP_013400602.1 thyrotropin-releasing hormone receptor [Lingula anatina]